MTAKEQSYVFDYRALRLLMGIIALALPIVVSIISSVVLTSISASYYTEARDVYVGMLFIVGSFWWAYNGHTPKEKMAGKFASVAAILVAVCPTACDSCEPSWIFKAHAAAAVTLFSILAYFCFGPFRKDTKGRGGKKGRRSKIYLTCGWIMVACMLVEVAATYALPRDTVNGLRITYWVETTALAAFGVAWIVAGKYLPVFVDPDEKLYLFR
jgi:hypothetical protein